jgi:hypothetical protein
MSRRPLPRIQDNVLLGKAAMSQQNHPERSEQPAPTPPPKRGAIWRAMSSPSGPAGGRAGAAAGAALGGVAGVLIGGQVGLGVGIVVGGVLGVVVGLIVQGKIQ